MSLTLSFSSAALRAKMRWPARQSFSIAREVPAPCSFRSLTLRHTSFRAFTRASNRPHFKPKLLSSVRKASQQAVKQEPIVIFRGGGHWRPSFYLAGGLAFCAAGFSIAPLVYGHLSWPIFSLGKDGKKPELARPQIRAIVAAGLAVLGAGLGWFFYMVPLRSITRITVHPASREVGIRTSLPSPLSFLPLSSARQKRLGFKHPLATKDGLSGSKPDRRTRVLPLTNVYRQFGQSKSQDYAIHQLSPRQRTILSFVLPTLSDSIKFVDKSGKSRSVVRSAKSTDLLYLDIKPFKLLFGVRAAGGAEVNDFVTQDGTPVSAKEAKQLQGEAGASKEKGKVRSRSLYTVGWSKFRNFLLQATDWDDLPAKKAEEIRNAGDPYIRGRFVETARRRGGTADVEALANAHVKPLGPKEPWFRDRANFDDLFPVSKAS